LLSPDLRLLFDVLSQTVSLWVLAASVGGDVGDALRRLAPELQDVLRAMVLDGLSVRETAVLLDLPEGTVKTRARRARIAMREALA
ncbi:sigma factor-like helix-turn-helix DNA-binding protein, partial [Streptomyces sp. NPDC007000]|uniref:sigma factor-like helix-turn-helix DNA-binding protein n=1 Tax=Streptomyces sp. NPDC007000 TaxID=3155357 RepID=UPI0034119D35